MEPNLDRVAAILQEVRSLAIQYQQETGKPLGITGEIAEFEAARLSGLKLADARQAGYDAILRCEAGEPKRVQIKGRCVPFSSKAGRMRVGGIKLDHAWDTVVLVLLDDEFQPTEIYEAERAAIEKALGAPGSRARNERGSLAISQFKSLAKRVWPL